MHSASYRSKYKSVVEGRQQNSFLNSVPVEFSGCTSYFRFFGTLAFVTDVGRTGLYFGHSRLIHHGNYSYTQTFT